MSKECNNCRHAQEGGQTVKATTENGLNILFKNGQKFIRYVCDKCEQWIGDEPVPSH